MPGLFIQKHAESAALNNNICLIYAQPLEGITQVYTEHNAIKGVESYLIYYPPVALKLPFISDLVKAFRYYKTIFNAIKNIRKSGFKADLVHIHILTRLGIPALWMKLRYGTPYIITEHWSRYLPITNTYHGVLRKFATKLVVGHANRITVVSKNLENAMLAHKIYGRYSIIHNVVDTELFNIRENKRPKLFTFVHVSCFENRSKNISGLLDSIKLLSESNTPFRVQLIGEGEDLEEMKKYCHSLMLDQLVEFCGLKTGQELSHIMAEANCLLLFSNYENMPVVINEGFACGLPVIATDVGGISEHVSKERGLLVPARDIDTLANAMKKMMQTSSSYNKQDIRNYALKHFSTKAVAGQLNSFYNEALNQKQK